MATAADRNARRRLQRLLDDEDYGPKLARLRGEDERRVLRLISENRGAEARAEIQAADERRRQRVRENRERQLFERAVRNTLAVHRPYYPTIEETDVRRYLGQATRAELQIAATGNRDDLYDMARRQSPPPSSTTREINPFWYH